MNNFTGVLADIENVIGTAATLQLVKERGGTKINIPKKPTEKCQLVQIIGLSLAEKLSLEFGSGEVLIPMGHFKGMGRKKVLAAQMLEQGLSSNKIAAELDIHERTVRRVKEKNYLGLPLIEYIEEQERKEKEHGKSCCHTHA
ncbi:MAG: helix-turn-helix domain-containing protein [Proteobacteria bacterium]|nr:helix-turn-helix domain-containing protein [Pseudomonadota bacterium]